MNKRIIAITIALLTPFSLADQVEVQDPAGDVAFDTASGVPLDSIDIVQSRATSTENALVINIETADQALDVHHALNAELWTEFEFRSETFHTSIKLGASQLDSSIVPVGTLYRQGNTWINLGNFDVSQSGPVFEATIPWNLIQDSGEFKPSPGNTIQIHKSESVYMSDFNNWHESNLPGVSFIDEAPFSEAALQIPGEFVASLAATTPHPLRFSNGEATTFHWPIELSNLASSEIQVLLSWTEPTGILLEYPAAITLAADETSTVHLFASVPFVHEHGSTLALPVEFHVGEDIQQLDLGILYPTIPQPAGHHNVMYLHGASDGRPASVANAWMNTDPNDPAATASSLSQNYASCVDSNNYPNMAPAWRMVLEPRLLIGLDARVDEAAVLNGQLLLNAPIPSSHLYGYFALESRTKIAENSFDAYTPTGSGTPIAGLLETGPIDFTLEIEVPEFLDLVSPTSTKNLVLYLHLCPDEPVGLAQSGAVYTAADIAYGLATGDGLVALVTGGVLTMPLNEYHDLIDIDLNATNVAISVQERDVAIAPGASVLWELEVLLDRPGLDEYEVTILGPHASDAVLLSEEIVSESGPIRVGLMVDGVDGELREIVVLATNSANPTDNAAVRLRAIVDSSSDRNDAELIKGITSIHEEASTNVLAAVVAIIGTLIISRKRS